MSTVERYESALAAHATATEEVVEAAIGRLVAVVRDAHPDAWQLDLEGSYEELGSVSLRVVAIRTGRPGTRSAAPDWQNLADEISPILDLIAEVRGHEYLGVATIDLAPVQ